ncbi:hypothetical protein [Streptomyces virginiae]|uniref:hypothetical protein n=1 Tax=Streptomyces virginiae TaxID=1961 RepID=UPI0036E90FEF
MRRRCTIEPHDWGVMVTLYGRAAVLDAVVPSLVGLESQGAARLRIPGGSPLLIECGGGRLTGKTALLKELSKRYAQRIPQAYADLGAADFGQPGLASLADETTANASRTSDLLFYLMDALSRKPNEFAGKLCFPRLTQGLLAVTSWQSEDVQPAELQAARRRLAGLLRESQPDLQARNQRVSGWIGQVTQGVSAAAGLGPGVSELVGPLTDIVTTELLGPRANRQGLGWWAGRRVGPQGDGHAQLTDLAMCFRGDGGDRRRAEHHLVAALLEDMADHYTWMRLKNRVPRPLLLLDNIHTPLGVTLLDALTRAWHDEPTRTHPGVVAAALAQEPVVPDAEGTAPSTRSAAVPYWRQDRPQTAAGWVLRLPMAQLDLDEVKEMFGDDRPEPDTAHVIHRLSAGRAGMSHALVLSVRQRIGLHEPVDHGVLLDLPLALPLDDGPTLPVYERLLRLLIPDGEARARLAAYTSALDDAAAHALDADHVPHGADGQPVAATARVPVAETKRLLRKDCWSHHPWPGTGGPFVGDPTLRALLVHDLRTRAGAAPGGGDWRGSHRRLRLLYAPGASDPRDACYLHHSLAIGDTDVVVRALHRRLAEQDAPGWLATLNLVCAAPHPPEHPAVPAADPVEDRLAADNDPVRQAVQLLVLNLWRQSHPLAHPDPRKVNAVRLQLLTLAQNSAVGPQEVFYQAYEEWPQLLNRWIQAPDLPTYGDPRP